MENLIINKIRLVCKSITDYDFTKQIKQLSEECELLLYEIQALPYNKKINISLNNKQIELTKLTKIQEKIQYVRDIDLLLSDNLADDELEFILEDVNEVSTNINNYIITSIIGNEEQHDSAILSIHSGAGGLESEDWAGMVLRMYIMWCNSNNYAVDILNITHSLEVNNGIKRVDLLIKGNMVYNLLKNETGVHRLIRKSPFSKTNSRHTSFISVKVIPDIDDEIHIALDERNDVRIDTLRGTGAGGQHRNKTDSAVRLTHFETGIIVFCQTERSQHRNKENAFKILRGRLYELELQKQKNESQINYKAINDISWGHQIRSYVLHPEQRVKDHRTNHVEGDFNNVLDGNLNNFLFKVLNPPIV